MNTDAKNIMLIIRSEELMDMHTRKVIITSIKYHILSNCHPKALENHHTS